MKGRANPEFLSVKPGDHVLIKEEIASSKGIQEYWIGEVLNCIGGARDPNSWTLFQVINIDNGEVLIINADIVELIFRDPRS